jgi:hypothetical protein
MKMKISSLLPIAFAAALVSCGKQETTVVETTNSASQPAEAPSAPTPADPQPASAPDPTAAAAPSTPAKPDAPALSTEESTQLEAWWKKYNLDPNDPAQLVADTDGDGYSNREEFLADTNPRDPNSLPGVMEGVAMKTLNEIKVPMILREVTKAGKARIQHTDGTEEIIAEGSVPKGSGFRVKAVKNQVKMDKHGVWTDMSQVTLENPESKETVFLVRDLPARSSQTHAVITGADGREQKVHFDETFTLASHPGKEFKVIDLRADQVVVQEVGGKTVLTIPKR